MEYKRIFWGQKSFRFWYFRYKDSPYYAGVITGIILVVSFILLIFFVVPQLQSWFSLREEAIRMEEKINTLQTNISYLQSLDQGKVQEQLSVAFTALPSERKVDTLLTTISHASITSGVSLGEFAFQVGNVSSLSAQVAQDPQARGLTTNRLQLIVIGDFWRIQKFLEILQTTLPLSEVLMIEGNSQSTTISLQFYQEPLPSFVFTPEEPIIPVSAQDAAFLDQLSGWNIPLPPEIHLPETDRGEMPLF